MATGIPESTVEEIKTRIDLADLISSYGIQVKHSGSSIKACCPFHNEKTPSFNINNSKGFYHCFGCGETGDAIKFVQKMDGLSFVEAVKNLASRCGVEVVEKVDPEAGKRKRLYSLMAELAQFYRRCLLKTREAQLAREYLIKRNLGDEAQEDFIIGYAPNGMSPMIKWAEKYGYSLEELEAAGVIKPPRNASDSGYHRFSSRLMFTICDKQGRAVAFSGRQLIADKKTGKYVNSPTSILYEKKHELYGFYQAKQAIKREDCCYLVEGQLDVIQLVQSGIENVVASGGTALTFPQVRMIHRFTDNVTILYDGDKAGIKAALRGIDMMLEEGVNVRVVLLPEGEDPDSFARQHDATEVLEYFKAHQTDFIRLKAQLLSEDAGDDPVKRADMITQIVQSIAIIPDIIKRQIYIKDCSTNLGIQESVLTRKVIELRKKYLEDRKKRASVIPSSSGESTESPMEGMTVERDVEATPSISNGESKLSLKDQNIQNLLQLIVRYGEVVIYQSDTVVIRVGEYIINELNKMGLDAFYKNIL